MESLTRNNYENWFVDYLDGHLSNEQLETLLDFLELNPDLKEELRGASNVSLPAGEESFDHKDLLLKSPVDVPGIAAIDQFCIARMENDLSEEEARKFDLRLDEDMELRGNYAAFRHTRLNPADKVIYPYKKELTKKTVIFSPWLITAISSAAIIMLVWFLWPRNQEKATSGLAKIETSPTINPQPATSSLQPATSSRPVLAANLQRTTNNPKRTAGIAVKSKPVVEESLQREIVPMQSLSHRSMMAGPRIPDPQNIKLLYASHNPAASDSGPAEKILTVPQYALQMFRERILGQDRKLVRKTRFSMWEVAGAGVDKINTLAGTKMKLNRQYDSKGDLLAVSFNSRLVDVESPVRAR